MSTAMTETDETTATDSDLLRHFAATRDEAAFAALVRRHGRLVWGVCRRRLSRREDAEDAFQAAFLILALKADSIRAPEALPGWLHRTAHRAALRVASASPVDASHDVPTEGLDAFAEVARREAATAIDEELVRLPDRYRNAVVLFHLEGLERRDVAARLGVSEPTVKGLLSRGRALLRTRLARRGVALPLLLPLAIEPVPAQTVAATCRLALSLTKAGLTPLDLVSVPAKGIQSMSALVSNKMAAAALVGAACLTLFLVTQGDANTSQNGEGAPTLNTTFVPTTDAQANEALAFAPIDEPPPASTEETKTPAIQPPSPEEVAAYLNKDWPPELIAASGPEHHIRQALDEETRFNFVSTPLSDVFQFLGDVHEINIVIEEKKLADAGVSPEETRIDLTLEELSLRSGLNLLSDDLGLAYIVEDDVLKITTKEAAAKHVSTQAYDLASLARDASAEEVAKAVETLLLSDDFTPVPDEQGWTQPRPRIVPFRDRLLVKATAPDHARIEEILQLMWRVGSRGPESSNQSAKRPSQKETTTPVTKIFPLQFAAAQEMALIITQAVPGPDIKVATEHRTNSLVVSGNQEQLKLVESLLSKFDVDQAEKPIDSQDKNEQPSPTETTTESSVTSTTPRGHGASLTAPAQRDLPRPTIELNAPEIKLPSSPNQNITVSGRVTKVPNGTTILLDAYALREDGKLSKLWGRRTEIDLSGEFLANIPFGSGWPTKKVRIMASIENMPHIAVKHDLEITPDDSLWPLPEEKFSAQPRMSDTVADFDVISPITVPTGSQFIVRGTVSAQEYRAAPSVPFELYLYPEAGRPNIVPGRQQPIMLLPYGDDQWFETVMTATVPPGNYVMRIGRKGGVLIGSKIPVTVTAAPEENDVQSEPSPSEATSEVSETSSGTQPVQEVAKPVISLTSPKPGDQLQTDSVITVAGHVASAPEGTKLEIDYIIVRDGKPSRVTSQSTTTDTNGLFKSKFSLNSLSNRWPPGPMYVTVRITGQDSTQVEVPLEVKEAHRSPRS